MNYQDFKKNRGFTPLEVRRQRRLPMRKRIGLQTGFTMVELIITIVILSFGIIGIYSFYYPASVLTSNFSQHLVAAYLAQDGLETVKNIRDNNILSGVGWSQGFSICTAGCQLDYKTKTSVETLANQLKAYNSNNFLNINSDGFYSYDTGTATIFKRNVTITGTSNSDILKVDVLVTWNYNGQPFNFDTIGYIYNY